MCTLALSFTKINNTKDGYYSKNVPYTKNKARQHCCSRQSVRSVRTQKEEGAVISSFHRGRSLKLLRRVACFSFFLRRNSSDLVFLRTNAVLMPSRTIFDTCEQKRVISQSLLRPNILYAQFIVLSIFW